MGCYQTFQKRTAKPIDTVEDLCRTAETKTTGPKPFDICCILVSLQTETSWNSVSSVRRAAPLST